MLRIVKWEYYSSLHSKIPDDCFGRYEKLAEKEVERVIGPIRWANITEQTFGYEQLKDCICSVMNALYEVDNSAQSKGITSVSNDGYSESYAVQTASQARTEMYGMIRQLLSGTGLVGAY